MTDINLDPYAFLDRPAQPKAQDSDPWGSDREANNNDHRETYRTLDVKAVLEHAPQSSVQSIEANLALKALESQGVQHEMPHPDPDAPKRDRVALRKPLNQ